MSERGDEGLEAVACDLEGLVAWWEGELNIEEHKRLASAIDVVRAKSQEFSRVRAALMDLSEYVCEVLVPEMAGQELSIEDSLRGNAAAATVQAALFPSKGPS